MLKFTKKKTALAVMTACLAILATGCFEISGNDMSGLGTDAFGGKYAAVRDPDGQHLESCSYPADPGCMSNGTRVAYDAVGPNGENALRGRELIWADIADTAVCGTVINGQPEYGFVGYGPFTPSTTNCLDRVIEEITDDQSDPNDDSSWVCVSGNSCHAAYGTVAAGTDPQDVPRTNWLRHFFDVGTLGITVARQNAQDWVWAMRDFYAVIITDPSLSGPNATGHPACVQMADNPTSGAKIKLGRWCI